MATYKVIQDIEAEDHILGPLTLRQFIYGLIAAFFFYLCFIVITKNVAFLLILFLPPGLFAAFFAVPFGKDQPTEIWALAKIRFLFKPRKRIWNQSGAKELVRITAPKKIETHLTNGLSQTEVKSRLQALADTIDSRGWVIKNVASGQQLTNNLAGSDRLIDLSSIPKPVPDYDVTPNDDILDDAQSPIAQQLRQMIGRSSAKHRKELLDNLNQVRAEQNTIKYPQIVTQPLPVETPTASDISLVDKIKSNNNARSLANANLHTIPSEPIVKPQPAKQVKSSPKPPVQPVTDPVIMYLSRDNNSSISTLSSEAKKAKEVVIDLRKEG